MTIEKTDILHEALAEVTSMFSELGLEVENVEITYAQDSIDYTIREFWNISIFNQSLRVVIGLLKDNTVHYSIKGEEYEFGYVACCWSIKDLKECIKKYIK